MLREDVVHVALDDRSLADAQVPDNQHFEQPFALHLWSGRVLQIALGQSVKKQTAAVDGRNDRPEIRIGSFLKGT